MTLGIHMIPVVWRTKDNGFSLITFLYHFLKIVLQDATVILYAPITCFARSSRSFLCLVL
jgi:hypothetical protein